ncbi:hypothetical protein U1Q18_036065, partial [Sarracenia purpurea var. burkii]
MTVATTHPQASSDNFSKWHHRLGHPSSRKLNVLASVLCLKNKEQSSSTCSHCNVL